MKLEILKNQPEEETVKLYLKQESNGDVALLIEAYDTQRHILRINTQGGIYAVRNEDPLDIFIKLGFSVMDGHEFTIC